MDGGQMCPACRAPVDAGTGEVTSVAHTHRDRGTGGIGVAAGGRLR